MSVYSCPNGYYDKTNGNASLQSCGSNCPGYQS